MCKSNRDWLTRRQYEERIANYRTDWDLYIRFYTVFLTANIVGIGAVVQYVDQEKRWPIVAAFITQNLVSAGTAFYIARFSKTGSEEVEHLAAVLAPEPDDPLILASPIPARIGMYGGWANFVSHAALIGCWVGVWLV